ncbi:hypothetical protein [Rugamonas rubra]|uniref:hypothetical protein n=1 Tax=Rugamonas rubra TaxID=758825 RepID=UPI001113E648|nr:hypothetical protein [Rugamonas rubra]
MPQKASAQMLIGSPEWNSAVQDGKRIEEDNLQREQRRAAEDEAQEIGKDIPRLPIGPRRPRPF